MNNKHNKIKLWIQEYGRCHSFSKVAQKFNIPRSTLTIILKNNGVKSTKDLIKEGKKKCTGPKGCNKIKLLNDFGLRKKYKIYEQLCKKCMARSRREYAENNKEKIRNKQIKYQQNNKEKIKEQRREYRKNNKEAFNIRHKIWRESNKEKVRLKSNLWSKNNRDKINKSHKSKISNNVNFKLAHNLRARLKQAIKKNQKTGSAVKDLGCSIQKLKEYLESQFHNNRHTGDEMTWNNYGFEGWHIDHIKPLASFNLSNREQFLEACHYTNLQPLWVEDHQIKTAEDIRKLIK